MATQDAPNGASAAEKLMAQHAHHVTVEDVPDDDSVAHPPPASSAAAAAAAPPSETPVAEPGSKAAAKQPASDAPPARKPALDTQSEELFPALGAPKTSAAAPSMWSKKPATVGKAANGQANGVPPASASARSTNLALPGRKSEAITLEPKDMIPRSELKKPLNDVLRDISKRSKANVAMRSGPNGSVIFEGTGPIDDVRVALKEVADQLCRKQKKTVPVPANIRGRIVGKQGATIQAISKRTGAHINISKQEAAEILEDDDSTVDVTIEGDPFAVELAKQDIERIVAEHTSSVNTRLKNVPAEYYPWLAAPQNQRLAAIKEKDVKMQIPHYYIWNEPPTHANRQQPAAFSPQPALPIQLAGERQAVAEAKAEIERQVQELERQLTLEQLSIEKARHQFILGEKGRDLQEFLQQTGCSIILPPDGHESEELAIVGPANKIEEATNKVMELATSMQTATADIGRAHANAPGHSRNITQYLQQRRAIEELERQHNARIVPDSSGAWQIYAKDGKNAMKARADIMNLAASHPPARFLGMSVDPFYHQHLSQSAAPEIRERHGVQVCVTEDGDVILVYEDRQPSSEYNLPRGAPQQADVKSFDQALREAQQEILSLMSGRQEIVSREVEAPVKFHDKIRRHVDRHHEALGDNEIPVQITYGGLPQPAPKRSQAPNVGLRGPQDSVDSLLDSLVAFIEQEKQDELERGYTLAFDFPQQYANHLIGRKGEHINKLREEFDVDIQLNEGKCEIKGPQAKANNCKKHILKLLERMEDEQDLRLVVDSVYHKDLIGPQGSQVNRLQDRYGVRVNFPRNKAGEDESSERRDNLKPNEISVRGPSKGAQQCRDELLSLLQYVRENSHTAVVSVAQSQLPSLIGAGGREMEALRLETGAQIDVPSARDASSSNGRVDIHLKGSKHAVENAKKMISEKAKVFDNTIVRTLDVDKKHHRKIIGGQGSNLRSIIVEAGGPSEPRFHNRMVRFPKGEEEGGIRVEGQAAVVEKICAAIEALVLEQESQIESIAEVKPDKHRLLIGRAGETRRKLEEQYGVSINIPRQTETGPQRSQVRISGRTENVDKAKARILEITKDQEGETVSVPRRFHHVISDNGQFFRRLRNDHKVTVDHDGQRPPARPTAPAPSRSNGGSMPLITDDPSQASGTYSWEEHDLHVSAEEGDIPWTLTGPSPEAIKAARGKLDKALEDAGKHDTIGYLILPDPRAYRHVIGPGGQEINRIRSKTGARIQVPRDQSQGEAIEIQGSKAGVQEAKDIILEIVQNHQ